MTRGAIFFLVSVILVIGASVVLLFTRSAVQSGELVVCEVCKGQVSSTVTVQSVPWWKAKRYHVVNKLGLCQACSQQSVTYVVRTLCTHCRREYRSTMQSATRTQKLSDVIKTEGYCDDCSIPMSYQIKLACLHCGRIYLDVQKTEPKWKKPPLQTKKEGYCTICDTAKPWNVGLKCEKCSKQYSTYQAMAKPKDDPKSEVSVGFCSWCKVRLTAKEMGTRTGEIGGDVIEGLIKGTRNR